MKKSVEPSFFFLWSFLDARKSAIKKRDSAQPMASISFVYLSNEGTRSLVSLHVDREKGEKRESHGGTRGGARKIEPTKTKKAEGEERSIRPARQISPSDAQAPRELLFSSGDSER